MALHLTLEHQPLGTRAREAEMERLAATLELGLGARLGEPVDIEITDWLSDCTGRPIGCFMFRVLAPHARGGAVGGSTVQDVLNRALGFEAVVAWDEGSNVSWAWADDLDRYADQLTDTA